ncbi:MAG: hypothetical protein R2828_30665 [Saprospiraceae bacterium]
MLKTLSTLVLVISCLSFAFAQNQQKIEEQSFPWSSSKSASIDLKFASNIKVNTWNKKELGIKTIITYSKEEYAKLHQMTVDDAGNKLSVVTDFNKDFVKKNDYNCWNCDEQNPSSNRECICFKLEFEVMVPQGGDISIETISGNIEMKNLNRAIQAKTISGFIDLGLKPNAAYDLKFKSVTGEIYTDFDLDLDQNSTAFSKRLNSSLNGGGSLIALETISGDIFFRKE